MLYGSTEKLCLAGREVNALFLMDKLVVLSKWGQLRGIQAFFYLLPASRLLIKIDSGRLFISLSQYHPELTVDSSFRAIRTWVEHCSFLLGINPVFCYSNLIKLPALKIPKLPTRDRQAYPGFGGLIQARFSQNLLILSPILSFFPTFFSYKSNQCTSARRELFN